MRLEKADEKARRDAERIIGDARRTADEVMRELDALRKMEKTDTDHHRANDARAALRRKLQCRRGRSRRSGASADTGKKGLCASGARWRHRAAAQNGRHQGDRHGRLRRPDAEPARGHQNVTRQGAGRLSA